MCASTSAKDEEGSLSAERANLRAKKDPCWKPLSIGQYLRAAI
jgi:hypothetical protein